jgi:hypothetical protein
MSSEGAIQLSTSDSEKNQKPGLVKYKSSVLDVSLNIEDYDEEEILQLYKQVLDSLLFPAHVQENLIATQSKEKKWQTIQMQSHVLKDSKFTKTSQFGKQ